MKLNWQRIWENSSIIIISLIPVFMLIGMLAFFILMDTSPNIIKAKVDGAIKDIQRHEEVLWEQQEQIEIIRIQVNQLRPLRKK